MTRGFRFFIVCESDLRMALELVQDNTDKFHPYFPLIKMIHDRLALDWEVCLRRHILREANS